MSLNKRCPFLGHFWWNRIILDEGHEVNATDLLSSFGSETRWLLSGTALVPNEAYMGAFSGASNALNFLECTLQQEGQQDTPIPGGGSPNPDRPRFQCRVSQQILSSPFGKVMEK